MAVTNPSDVDSAIPEIWARNVFRDTLREGFWGKFAGVAGQGTPIVQQTELLNKPGDLIHIQTTGPLSGAGVSGDTAGLVGNEEKMSTSEFKVAPLLYGHAVRVNRRANKKNIIELRQEAKMRLSEWGKEKVDDKRFAQFASITNSDVPDNAGYSQPNAYAVGTGFATDGSVTVNSVATGNKLTVAELRKIRYALQAQNCTPFYVNGLPWFGLIITPEQEYDLKTDSTYGDYVVNAASRGFDNPVFTGAIANVEGLAIYSHFNVPTATSSGSGTPRAGKGIAFGAEAFVEGWDEDVNWAEDEFEYGLEWGVAYRFAFQPRRALDKQSMMVYATAVIPT